MRKKGKKQKQKTSTCPTTGAGELACFVAVLLLTGLVPVRGVGRDGGPHIQGPQPSKQTAHKEGEIVHQGEHSLCFLPALNRPKEGGKFP